MLYPAITQPRSLEECLGVSEVEEARGGQLRKVHQLSSLIVNRGPTYFTFLLHTTISHDPSYLARQTFGIFTHIHHSECTFYFSFQQRRQALLISAFHYICYISLRTAHAIDTAYSRVLL